MTEVDKLKKVYLKSFLIVIFLTIVGQAVIQYFIYDQKEFSRIVNIAGKQRMLSQKLSKLGLLSLKNTRDESSRSRLAKVLKEINLNHFNLTEGQLKFSFNDSIDQKYLKLAPVLVRMNSSADCLIENCLNRDEATLGLASVSDIFLELMNKIVYEKEAYIRNQVLFLSKLELCLFFLIVMMFFYEFFWIMLPISETFIEQAGRLAEKNKQVHHQSRLADIGQLTAGVGHEINNPLAIISGNNQLSIKELKKDKLDKEKLSKYSDKIELASERIRLIVDGMRKYSRLDSSEIVPMNVYESINETISLVSEIYKSDGVKIEITAEDKNIEINGNTGKFHQIIMNLLSNAKDATEGSSNRLISVDISRKDNKAFISIRDNGIGIPDEIKDKILTPFFTTKPAGKGTGMGLGIVAELINSMNGSLEIKSEVGRGSCFVVSLDELGSKLVI